MSGASSFVHSTTAEAEKETRGRAVTNEIARNCFPLAFSFSGPQIKNPYISSIHKDFSIFCDLFIKALRAENGTRTRDPQLGKFIAKTMKITIQQQHTISMFQKFVNYTSTTVKNYCFYDVNLTKISKIYIYQDIKSYCTPSPMYGFIPCGVRLCSTGNLRPRHGSAGNFRPPTGRIRQ